MLIRKQSIFFYVPDVAQVRFINTCEEDGWESMSL